MYPSGILLVSQADKTNFFFNQYSLFAIILLLVKFAHKFSTGQGQGWTQDWEGGGGRSWLAPRPLSVYKFQTEDNVGNWNFHDAN